MNQSANSSLFFYQNGKLVTVKQGNQQRSILRNDGMPLAEVQTGETVGTGLLATDDKGSVLNVQDTEDLEGHNFSAYGHDPNLPSMRITLGFNGEAYVPGAASYLLGLGYRSYSPRLRRFLAADSWSPFGQGGLNAYCYCEGDPVNSSDPSGHVRLYLRNGQILQTKKNMASSAGTWMRPPGFDKSAHRKALIDSTLQKPRRVLADNPVKEGSTHVSVLEVFRNPGSSIEKVHIKATDLGTFKRNRAEIGVLIRLHEEGNKAPSLDYRSKAAELMNQNEAIANAGEALWRKSMASQSPDTAWLNDKSVSIRVPRPQ
ncbi:RHS repeat-associated core domain-containing protein [Pseudomonas sp. Marseille-Q5299]|uniref:RHS repeat-associated core domain-containing protein n=1 Tax=Pseudomonas sp. Marseille-Q5299 TaxID=2942201 RepID=UPI00207317AB|nr:RHS repeat-associated core domain-containing protein [Pseudomonas sp. Marseille-Q5299]